ncbi:uncharacterized protein PAC_01711 [Phialocephala subalpina]|uniref:Copper transport protein n=1 Tax=Phialocephala subalpina TaxID=576137 RepID=A0A1L7WGD5_9HELO|nr:uncharacterized protein PAC_01711 [Phialocephala subalpina]
MNMETGIAAVSSTATSVVMIMATGTSAASATTTAMAMSMGGSSGCKLSMLLNWTTIDACFLFSAFHIRSSFVFFLACLGSFLLVISLELLRRFQREFDRYLRARKFVRHDKEYVLPEEVEEKLLDKGAESGEKGARKERWVLLYYADVYLTSSFCATGTAMVRCPDDFQKRPDD